MRVLVIDDDRRLFELIEGFLRQNDVEPTQVTSGLAGLDRLTSEVFDAVLLDVMMPGMNGLEVLRRIRENSRVPVIMLTAKGDETDRVVGLELGADDYVSKPFGPRELLARLRAVVRRAQPDFESERQGASGILLEVTGRRVWADGQPVELTGIEFDLLLALVRRAGRVVPRSSLLALAGRGDVAVNERTVDVHISHLRKKLGDDSRPVRRIQTVRGVGYILAKGDE